MKIVTALTNEILNEKIKKINKYEVICKDIQYQEALLEIIEKNREINILIISNILEGELTFFELINLIKYKNEKIKIIVILDEQNDNTIKFLIKKGITEIFINNKVTVEEIIEKIELNQQKNEEKIKEKNKNSEKSFFQEIKKIINWKIKKINRIKKEKTIKTNKKIGIIGARKTGKTIIMILIAMQYRNKKILLINHEKNDLNIILGKKNRNEIQRYNKNIDFINKCEDLETENFKKYDYIFCEIEKIEGKEENLKKYDNLILIVEPNLIGIKETREILEKLIIKQNIKKENIKIIFNKINNFSIKNEILKQIFSDFKIIGKVKNSNYYTYLINKNFIVETTKIKKEYKKIIKKME